MPVVYNVDIKRCLIFLIFYHSFLGCDFLNCYNAKKIVDKLKNPLAVEFINNNNDMLIAEQLGVIKLFNKNTKSLKIFLNLTDRVMTTDNMMEERGLLGFTIDPNFKENKYFYVFYSKRNQPNNVNVGHYNVIVRFQAQNTNGELKVVLFCVLKISDISPIIYLSKICVIQT